MGIYDIKVAAVLGEDVVQEIKRYVNDGVIDKVKMQDMARDLHLVRFPNCHECQLGFQCPKKWEIGKQWPILEENSIAAATYWDKLTSYMSHKAISAT